MSCISWRGVCLICDQVALVSWYYPHAQMWWAMEFQAYEIPALPLCHQAQSYNIQGVLSASAVISCNEWESECIRRVSLCICGFVLFPVIGVALSLVSPPLLLEFATVCVCHSGTIFVVLRSIDILIHNLIFTAKVPFGSHFYLWKIEGRQPSSFSLFSVWQQWVLDHSSHNSVFCLCPSHWNQPQCMLITQVEMLVGTEYTLLLKFSPLLTSTLSSRLYLWQLCSSSFPTSLFPQFVHL